MKYLILLFSYATVCFGQIQDSSWFSSSVEIGSNFSELKSTAAYGSGGFSNSFYSGVRLQTKISGNLRLNTGFFTGWNSLEFSNGNRAREQYESQQIGLLFNLPMTNNLGYYFFSVNYLFYQLNQINFYNRFDNSISYISERGVSSREFLSFEFGMQMESRFIQSFGFRVSSEQNIQSEINDSSIDAFSFHQLSFFMNIPLWKN